MKGEVGRNTILTEELLKQIKQSILDGNDLKTTAKVCEINEGTFYVWHSDNYLNLATKIEGWKRDRRIKLAEVNVDEFLLLDTEDSNKLKVKADITKFVLETLDKDNYSKRSENTGKNGEPLILNINSVIADKNNINESTQEPDFNS